MIAGSWTRITALVLRYVYLLKGSTPRLIELIYWPTVEIILWGFFSDFLGQAETGTLAQAAGVLVAAVLLWDVMFRSQLGVAMAFLEEVWSRNLGHLFVAPLRPWEWLAGLLSISVLRAAIGLLPAGLLAAVFFGFDPVSLGLGFVAFLIQLPIMGWCLGVIIVSLILRLGAGAESLAWMSAFLIAPISCIYYPVAALPDWLEPVALALPSTHVFEGLRGVRLEGVFHWDHLAWAIGLNLIGIALATVLFRRGFRAAQRDGKLLQQGE